MSHILDSVSVAISSNVNFPGGVAVMTINHQLSIGNLIVKPIGILTEREIIKHLVNEKRIPNKLLAKITLQFFSHV
jgi:hypothetical protein